MQLGAVVSNPNSTIRREQRARDNEAERLGLIKRGDWRWDKPPTEQAKADSDVLKVCAIGSRRKRTYVATKISFGSVVRWQSQFYPTMTACYVAAELCNWGQA